MLSPEQLGCLAALVKTAIERFPNQQVDKHTTRKVFEDADYMEPWEKWLKKEINHRNQCVDMPDYDQIGDEVEMFVNYFAYSPAERRD